MKSKFLNSTTRAGSYQHRPAQKTIGEYMEAGEAIPASRFLGFPGLSRTDIVERSTKGRGFVMNDSRLNMDNSPSAQAVEQLQAAMTRSMAKHKGGSK